ncbi:MAG TPA: alpha/beta hydrolase [Steroidobacteraceae bacterium]|jgi:pimeloyl-ACP methyl ester carboxylesterase
MTTYHTQTVGNVEVFYRQAGPVDAPVVLLLHGFPTSSHMFRELIPLLAMRYRVIAPDLPGFGNTMAPARGKFAYSFDNLGKVISGFLDAMSIARCAMYVFDYGAPTGYRVALAKPERISAIVSQNGNAYLEGFSDAWGPWQTYWREPTPEHREACRESLSAKFIREWQYFHGSDPKRVSPDGYTLDIAYLQRPGAEEIQLDLILDYRSNVALYPDIQAYFRQWQPPFLAVWGQNDAHFIPPGALAYKRDLPKAQVHFLDTGHFALETHAADIAHFVLGFLSELDLNAMNRPRSRP